MFEEIPSSLGKGIKPRIPKEVQVQGADSSSSIAKVAAEKTLNFAPEVVVTESCSSSDGSVPDKSMGELLLDFQCHRHEHHQANSPQTSEKTQANLNDEDQ